MSPEALSDAVGALRVDVSGTSGGRPTTLSACGTGTMRDTTGVALSIGTILAGSGQVTSGRGGANIIQ